MLLLLLTSFLHAAATDYAKTASFFPKRPGTWTYEGSLMDPLNGNVIARVVGIERFTVDNNNNNNTPAKGFLSRKVFCYMNETNAQQPMEYYRARFNGPQRRIPLSESVVQSNAIVRYFPPGYISTEFMDTGYVVLGKIESSKSNGLNIWKVVSSPVKGRPEERVKELQTKAKDSNGSTKVVIPRQSWIQLGGTGTRPGTTTHQRVRETYDYRNEHQLSYTRYGEGPAWYGPGRTVQLELTGQWHDNSIIVPTALVPHIPKDFWDDGISVKRIVKKQHWWTRLRAATQFTVGGQRRSFESSLGMNRDL